LEIGGSPGEKILKNPLRRSPMAPMNSGGGGRKEANHFSNNLLRRGSLSEAENLRKKCLLKKPTNEKSY